LPTKDQSKVEKASKKVENIIKTSTPTKDVKNLSNKEEAKSQASKPLPITKPTEQVLPKKVEK
jgi:hypothetical protein